MTAQQLRWRSAQTTNAKRIDPRLWEAHRVELSELYQRMTLEDLMVFMRIKYQFCPSRRQYVTQLGKWGIRKYTTASQPLFSESGSSTSSSTGSRRISVQSFTPCTLSASPPTCTSTIPPIGKKRGHPGLSTDDTRPIPPPKKRKKLAEFLASRPESRHEIPARSPPETSNCESTHVIDADSKRLTLPPHFGTSIHPKPTPAVEEGSTVALVASITSLSSDGGLSGINNVAVSFPPSHHRLESPRRDVLILPKDSLIDILSPDEANDVKLAADFFLSTHCYSDAFTLFALHLTHVQQNTPRSSGAISTGIINCARSCRTQPQMQFITGILEDAISKRPPYAVDTAESFLFRSMLADLQKRSGNISDAKYHMNIASRSAFEDERSLSKLPNDNRAFDFPVWHCLERSNHHHRLSGQLTASPGSLKQQVLIRVPGPFEYKNGHLGNPTIQRCLKWFRSSLAESPFMNGPWQNTKPEERHNKERNIFISLFAEMWQRLRRLSPCEAGESLSWACHVDEKVGISVTELLAICCHTVLRACPPSTRMEIDLKHYLEVGGILQYAARVGDYARYGCRRLSKFDDAQLADAFLDAYLDFGNLFSEKSLHDRNYNTLLQDYIRGFVQDSMNLILPEKVETEIPATDAAGGSRLLAIIADRQCCSHTLPTLASSLSSLDFGSFAELRDRALEGIEDRMSSLSLELPSIGVGNVSGSSLNISTSRFFKGGSSRSLISTVAASIANAGGLIPEAV